jgi:hypothetical protein
MSHNKIHTCKKVVNFLWKIERGAFNFAENFLIICSKRSNHYFSLMQPIVVAVVVACSNAFERFISYTFFCLRSILVLVKRNLFFINKIQPS